MYIFCCNSCQSSISSPPFPVIYQTLQNSTSFPDPSQLQNGAFAECPRLVQAGLEHWMMHETPIQQWTVLNTSGFAETPSVGGQGGRGA